VGAAWRIVDWGGYSNNGAKGASRNRIRVGEDSPVGWSLLTDRDPRIHSICILVEAEVDGKMKVQDTLEVIEIEAFPPHLCLRTFPMTTISS